MVHFPGFGHEEHEAYQRTLAENEELRARLAHIEGSDAYQLSLGLEEEISALVGNKDELLQAVGGDVDDAVARAKDKEVKRRAAPVIRARVAETLLEQTAEIDQQVEAEADEAAARAKERFLREEAGQYREKARDRLVRARVAGAVLGVKREIEDEVVADVAAEGGEVAAAQPEPETPAQLKARAAEIRKRTHNSQILPYSMLRQEDVITLCFASEGHGCDAYTTPSGSGWGNTYDTSRERRKLTVKLLDPNLGAFEVLDDSYWNSGTMGHLAVRSGRQVLILAENRDTTDGLKPILVKGEMATIQAVGGKEIGNPRLDLWWVGIGKDEYRVLS